MTWARSRGPRAPPPSAQAPRGRDSAPLALAASLSCAHSSDRVRGQRAASLRSPAPRVPRRGAPPPALLLLLLLQAGRWTPRGFGARGAGLSGAERRCAHHAAQAGLYPGRDVRAWRGALARRAPPRLAATALPGLR